jgi:hypothetical protein
MPRSERPGTPVEAATSPVDSGHHPVEYLDRTLQGPIHIVASATHLGSAPRPHLVDQQLAGS